MKKLFTGLSIFLVLCGLFALLGGVTNVGVALLALGMTGIGVAAYNKRN